MSSVWIIAVAVVALGVTSPITLAVTRSITAPIRQVGSAANELSQGKLSVLLEEHNRKDEIGNLSRSFRAVVDDSKDMATLSLAIASGDLSVQAKPRSEDDMLSHAF